QTVIGERQGRMYRLCGKYRGLDTVQTAHRCDEYIAREEPDAFVIDADGLGAGVFDNLKSWGYGTKTVLVEFHGNGVPANTKAYFNKRAEMWGEMRDWIKAGAQIPDDP